MNSSRADIVQDMVILYELALAIGTSLDLEANSITFFEALLRRKNLHYAGLWIDAEHLPGQRHGTHVTLAASHPSFYAMRRTLPRDHALFAQAGSTLMLTFDVADTRYVHELDPVHVTTGSVALFRLKQVGWLLLYDAHQAGGFLPRTLNQIRSLVDKFANSVQACLSNEHNLWAMDEQRRAEAEIRRQRDLSIQVMEAMGQGLILTGVGGQVEYTNPVFASVIGVPREMLIGQDPLQYVLSADRATVAAHQQRVIEHGERITYPLRLARQDGQERHLLATAVPRMGSGGRPDGVITVVTDFTEQKEIETRLAYARDQALEASRLKSDFLATMSHEIRTPMNAIIGMSELLLQTPLNGEQQEFADVIMTEAEALLHLIEGILDFSKIEAGKMILDMAPLGLRRTVEAVADSLALKAQEKGLTLTVFVDPTLPDRLLGDRGRLRQVLLNLLGNAVKFTSHGSVCLRVDRLVVSQPPEQTVALRFSVSDTGIGIAPEMRDKLFEPFVQADSSHTRQYGGTGLGLAVSARIVALMDSHLTLESTPGQGATFAFDVWLPVDQDAADDAEAPLSGQVLVIDSCKSSADVLRHYLAAWGLDVTVQPTLDAVPLGPFTTVIANTTGQESVRSLLEAARSGVVAPTSAWVLLAPHDNRLRETAPRACVILTLPVRHKPLYKAVARGATAAARGPSRQQQAVPAAAPVDLLVVEDNEMNQQVITAQLERLGYRPHVVGDGQQGVAALLAAPGRYPLVLMDIQMPVMNGYVAAQRIREAQALNDHQPIIIAMTASATPGERERCLASGMDDIITKPVGYRLLAARLKSWLERSHGDPID